MGCHFDDCNGVPTTTTEPVTTCPSEEIYGEASLEVPLLRAFRDNLLSKTPEGQELIQLYYRWSPVIVKMIEKDESFKQEVKQMIDEVLPLIRELVE
jgi:cell wall-associated protease